jgi:DNA polymerase-3 subunit epsilon
MKKYNGYKKCFIDLETTGVDRKLNHIFQLSGAITDLKDNVIEEFDFRFRPHSILNLEDSALDKTGVDADQLRSFPMSSEDAFVQFVNLLSRHCDRFNKEDKLQFIAYNAKFDDEFLREWFLLNNDNFYGSWFWTPAICVMQWAAAFLIDVRGALPNFKLGTLCECAELGWEEEKAHDAKYDIEKTIALYKYLRKHTRILGE